MCYLPLHKKKKDRFFSSILCNQPRSKNRIENIVAAGHVVAICIHRHRRLASFYGDDASRGCVGSYVSSACGVEICWSLFFPFQQEGKVRVEEKSGGLLTSFDESVFFVGTRRLSIRFLFTFCHGAPLFSLLCPFSASLLGDSRVRGCSADIKLHTQRT